MKAILDEMLAALSRGERVVLCSILASSGSVPRGAGAKMAVFEDGRVLGTIGGGAVAVYFQFFAPEQTADVAVLKRWREMLDRDVDLWLLLSLDGDGVNEFHVVTREEIPQDKADYFSTKAVWKNGIYVEPLCHAGSVYIFGGGHVGRALVPVLATVGFRVVMYDNREELAKKENYPMASEVIFGSFSDISGKVALKLHTGEPGGPNIIPREWVKEFQAKVPGTTIVECNVFYASPRQTTEGHRKTLETNGWTFSPVDIMDEEGDTPLPIKGGKWLKEVHVGSHLLSYDSMIVLTHFKGHTMGGFGGCLKNVAIGCASGKLGKWELHHEGSNDWAGGPHFMERMVEGGKAVVDHFGQKITYLSVMRRMSVDCDCVGTSAAEPTADDIGILASTDILAIDKAAIDLVYALPEAQRHDLVERIESRSGLRQLSYMRELHMGTDQYDLIEV